MRGVKKILLLSVLLIVYVGIIGILLCSTYMYCSAYQSLSYMISHPSVGSFGKSINEEE